MSSIITNANNITNTTTNSTFQVDFERTIIYDSMWNSIKDKYEAMNIGTLMKYANEYDTIKYNLYFNYYIPLEVANKEL